VPEARLNLFLFVPVLAFALFALVFCDFGFSVFLDTRHALEPFHFSTNGGLSCFRIRIRAQSICYIKAIWREKTGYWKHDANNATKNGFCPAFKSSVILP
jgi:hypothetical protein